MLARKWQRKFLPKLKIPNLIFCAFDFILMRYGPLRSQIPTYQNVKGPFWAVLVLIDGWKDRQHQAGEN